MNFEPLPHQKLMRAHLQTNPTGPKGLLCGMGLSKSAACLSVINDEFLDGEDSTTLIVAPLRVARLTWPNEIRKWDQFRWMKPEILTGQRPSGKSAIYCINYERMQKLKDLSFCKRVIFDELTKCKNPKSERANHIRKLFKGHQRWGLTGTPRPNSLLDLFAQVRLLDDGQRLGVSYTHFQAAYFTPVDHMEYNWVPKPGAEQRIYERIHDLCLTLRTSDYTDTADTIVEDVEVALSKDAHEFYRKLERELVVATENMGDVVAINAAALVNKLRQVTAGTVYDENRGVIEVHSGKINALRRLLADADGSVLIATNFIHERERICRALGPQAVDASKFKGDIETTWNSGKIKWLVADPRTLGHGLNMQEGGRTIVWFSPTYSREDYDQLNARLARRGQKQIPLVYRIISPGTIDDAVLEALREKGEGQSTMLRVLNEWRKMGRTFAKVA